MIKNYTSLFRPLAVVLACTCSSTLHATIIALDSASDAAYSARPVALNSLDGGYGFGAWSVDASGGTATANTLSSVNVFLLANTNGQELRATRSIDTEVGIGETFSVLNFAISSTPLIGATEIILRNNGSDVASLYWGGQFTPNWFFNHTGSGISGGNGLNGTTNLTSNLRIDYTRTALNGFTLEFYSNGSIISTATQTGSLTAGSSAIDAFAFRVAENGTRFDAQQLQVVPEPSTYAMLIAGGLAMGGAAMRRRRLARG